MMTCVDWLSKNFGAKGVFARFGPIPIMTRDKFDDNDATW
jgi:hypothetical protein